jgi:hypothetical protein
MIFKNSVLSSQNTHCLQIIKINWLMLFRDIKAVYCGSRTEHINTTCGNDTEILNVIVTGIYEVAAKFC